MKCVDENMKDRNVKERDSYEKSIIRRLVESNGEVLTRLAGIDKRNEDETK